MFLHDTLEGEFSRGRFSLRFNKREGRIRTVERKKKFTNNARVYKAFGVSPQSQVVQKENRSNWHWSPGHQPRRQTAASWEPVLTAFKGSNCCAAPAAEITCPLKSGTPQNVLISPQGRWGWDRSWQQIKEGSTLLKNRSEKKKTPRNIILHIANSDNLNSSKRLINKTAVPRFPDVRPYKTT